MINFKNNFKPDLSTFKDKKILKVRTLSPIHISNGEEYANLDYFIKDGMANIINLDEVFRNMDENMIETFTKLIKNNMNNNRMEMTVEELYYSVGIDLSNEKFILKKVNCKIRPNARVKVKQFINQKNKFYIPGSSIKGAIRTAYIFDYYDKNINELVDILEDKGILPNKKGSEVVKRCIGNIQEDFFKNLLITDSNFIDENNFEFIECRRYNTYEFRKNKNSRKIWGNPEYNESLKKNVEFSVELTIKEGFPKDIKGIKNMCNKLMKTVIDYELNHKYIPENLKKYYNNIKNNINKNNNTFYLSIGSGSGFLSKTIYLLLWKHKKDINLIKKFLPTKKNKREKKFQKVENYLDFPRTRVIYEGNKIYLPMGWIELSY